MYYDIDEILREELEAVNFMLSRLGNAGNCKEELVLRSGKKERTYYRRVTVVDQDGIKRRHSEKLGTERHPKVIEIKQKKYNAQLKKELLKAKVFLENSIGKYNRYDIDAVESALPVVYRDNTGLVNKDPVFMAAEEWSRRPYSRNQYPYGYGSNITSDGTRVRSKSEIIIYDQLTYLGIPFRCDAEVHLKDESGTDIHKDADFVIGAVHGRPPVLEHLGRIAHNEYMKKAMKKLQLYNLNGYTLNKDLFLTADDREGTIDAHATMQLIRKMILPKTQTR